MEKYLELFARLAAKFTGEDEVKTFTKGGVKLNYVTARTIMNRLDDVLGPANWWDEYVPMQDSVLCRLTVRLPDGTTLTKCDAGGGAGMKDAGDDDKSAYSDALKRAAVKWGVGRYLYRDGVPQFVRDELARLKAGGKVSQVETVSAQPEPAPAPAPPMPGRAPERPATRPPAPHPDNPPTTGKALFAWLCKQSEKAGVDYVRQVEEYGRTVGWPDRILDYSALQVGEAVAGIAGEAVTA